MIADLRLTFRLLAKNRGFTVVALLTLALCIGANTAIFSAVYALLLKPLPYPDPGRIVEIYNSYDGKKGASNVVQYLDYKGHTKSFSHFGLRTPYQAVFGEDTATQRLWGARVTADFFQVLGLQPVIGQYFTLENSRLNADRVVVLT